MFIMVDQSDSQCLIYFLEKWLFKWHYPGLCYAYSCSAHAKVIYLKIVCIYLLFSVIYVFNFIVLYGCRVFLLDNLVVLYLFILFSISCIFTSFV